MRLKKIPKIFIVDQTHSPLQHFQSIRTRKVRYLYTFRNWITPYSRVISCTNGLNKKKTNGMIEKFCITIEYCVGNKIAPKSVRFVPNNIIAI